MTAELSPRPATAPVPLRLRLLGWFWIMVGGFLLLAALMEAVAHFAYHRWSADWMAAAGLTAADMQGGGNLLVGLIDALPWLALGHGGVALLALLAASQLLRRRAWARPMLAFLSWLVLIHVVLLGGFWLYLWITLMGEIPQAGLPFHLLSFRLLGAGITLFALALAVVPLLTAAWYLGSRGVRQALEPLRPMDPEQRARMEAVARLPTPPGV